MDIDPWGEPEARRLLWMTQRSVTQLLYTMEAADQDDVTATALAIAWENQQYPISQKLVLHCIVYAYDKIFENGALIDQPRFAGLTDAFVLQPELIDPPDNLIVLDQWKRLKQM